jgi:hypothetical protein
VNELTVSKTQLPDNIQDLTRFVLIGREKLAAVRAEMRAIDKLGLANDFKKLRLEEAQILADDVLDAEVIIWKLLKEIPKATPNNNPFHQKDSDVLLVTPKQQARTDIGISRKQADRFVKLADNKDIVMQAKEQSRISDDIVTRELVFKMMDEKKKEEKRQEIQQKISEQIKTPQESQSIDIYSTDIKYRVIYADPPWSYNDKCEGGGPQSRGASGVYPVMSIYDLCDIPIVKIFEDNAVLFLWVTAPLLEKAIDIFNTWGFTYKTCAVM